MRRRVILGCGYCFGREEGDGEGGVLEFHWSGVGGGLVLWERVLIGGLN